MSPNSWQTYFDSHAHEYMSQWFTQSWREEVDFLEQQLGLKPGKRILDVGCGAGRHTVELARRGYQVTGLDFSTGMLAEAKRRAQEAGVEVEWIHGDATQFTSEEKYDGAICMLEAAIGLIAVNGDPHEHDLAVMRAVCAVLNSGATFIVEVPNAIRMLRNLSEEAIANNEFDLERMVNTSRATWDTPEGVEKGIMTSARNYVPTELKLMLQLSGFSVNAFSGKSASHAPIELDDYTIIAIARKE
ncbi:MAG: class I SAM-dependent methyltransferase [Chloroflexota bacterium]